MTDASALHNGIIKARELFRRRGYLSASVDFNLGTLRWDSSQRELVVVSYAPHTASTGARVGHGALLIHAEASTKAAAVEKLGALLEECQRVTDERGGNEQAAARTVQAFLDEHDDEPSLTPENLPATKPDTKPRPTRTH